MVIAVADAKIDGSRVSVNNVAQILVGRRIRGYRIEVNNGVSGYWGAIGNGNQRKDQDLKHDVSCERRVGEKLKKLFIGKMSEYLWKVMIVLLLDGLLRP